MQVIIPLLPQVPLAPRHPHTVLCKLCTTGNVLGGKDVYRGTSLMRNRTPLGPYTRAMPRFLGGWAFLMSEVPL